MNRRALAGLIALHRHRNTRGERILGLRVMLQLAPLPTVELAPMLPAAPARPALEAAPRARQTIMAHVITDLPERTPTNV